MNALNNIKCKCFTKNVNYVIIIMGEKNAKRNVEKIRYKNY